MRVLIVLFLLGLVTIPFQNCSKTGQSSSSSPWTNVPEKRSDTVVGLAQNFNKISYRPMRETFNLGFGLDPDLELNLDSGQLNISNGAAKISCVLETRRLQSLRDLIAQSKICQPAPLPSGGVSCLAASLPDIELSNGTTTVELSPLICNSGTYLCDGNDDILRNEIQSLLSEMSQACAQ